MNRFSQSISAMLRSRANLLLILLSGLFLLYAALFIARTSFLLPSFGSPTRVFVLFDDAMISMRYARNLADGYGLVWNPGGERVEGYTNLGWVLFMAAAHHLPVGMFKVSLLIQIAAVIFLLLNVLLTHAVSRWAVPGAPAVALAAAGLTAFYYPLNYWGLTGMEVSLCVLVVTTAILLISRGRDFTALLLLGASIWLRLDMVVVFLAVWGHCILFRPGRRLFLTLAPAVILIAALGSQTLWRIWYYGDHLPNTYYLKMTGFPATLRVLRGAVHFGFFFLRSTWVLILAAAISLTLLASTGRLRIPRFSLNQLLTASPLVHPLTLLAACFAAQAAYSIYVGGDAWERLIACNRFISVVIPLFFILYALALHHVAITLSRRRSPLVFAALLIVSLINLNSFPRNESLAQWLLIERPTFSQVNAENVRFALAAKKITTPEAVLAVDAAGVIPYFLERPCIDLLGKCDRVVAHRPMHRYIMTDSPLREFYPGHLKWDYEYSIGHLRPDFVMSRWGRSKTNSDDFLIPNYNKVKVAGLETWLLQGSPHVRNPNP